MKTCTNCGIEKDLQEFNKTRKSKDGHSSICRPCHSQKLKDWRARNAEKIKAKTRTEEYRAYHRETQKRFRATEHGKKWQRDWVSKHPELIKIHQLNKNSRLRGADGKVTYEEWVDLLYRCDHRCLKCERGDVEITADHIIPISKGGPHAIHNLQPLCRSCNNSKKVNTTDYRPPAVVAYFGSPHDGAR